jgi:cell volume regulation protein A
MAPALNIIVLLAFTIVLGYIGSVIFKRTKIPDIIWLLIFGIAVVSSGFVTREPFSPMISILAPVALLVILFDAGLNMDFHVLVRGFSRSMLLAVLGMIFSTVAVGAVGILIGLNPIPAFMLGAILSGTSSVVVLSIIRELRMRKEVRTFLSLESILTDPLCVIVAVALLGLLVPIGVGSPIQGIMVAFGMGIFIGALAGLAWLVTLNRLRGMPFDYMLTLAMAFLVYVGGEFLGGMGAGPIAVFFFGLVLGNKRSFSNLMKREYWVPVALRRFQGEITFFIRSFFFVYLGIIASIQWSYLAYGIAIAAALVLVRLASVQLAMRGMPVYRRELNLMRIMGPRGLAAAVLAQLPVMYNLDKATISPVGLGPDIFPNVAFVVIFATVIYASLWTIVLEHRRPRSYRWTRKKSR